MFPQWFLLTTILGTCWTDSFLESSVFAKMKVCKALILGYPPDHPFIQLGRFRDSTLTLISDWSFPTTIAKFTTITWLGLPCTNLVTQCPSHCHKNALWQLCLLTELYFMKSSISDLFISPNTVGEKCRQSQCLQWCFSYHCNASLSVRGSSCCSTLMTPFCFFSHTYGMIFLLHYTLFNFQQQYGFLKDNWSD